MISTRVKFCALLISVFISVKTSAQIVVGLGVPRTLPADGIFGMNAQRTVKANTGMSLASSPGNGLPAAINQFHLDYLRYPGTLGNYWDWQKGDLNGDSAKRKKPEGMHNSVYDLKDFVSKLNPPPQILYNLNVVSDNFHSQVQFMQTAQKLGLGPKYAELGAELYLPNKNFNALFHTGADYGNAMIPWCDTMKKNFPHLKLAIVGSTVFGDKQNRRNTWNSDLFSVIPASKYDAVTFHFYMKESNLAESDVLNESDVASILAEPFRQWDEMKSEMKKIPAGKEIWITEFNQSQDKVPSHGSWTHGLYCAAQDLIYTSDPRVTMIELHEMVGSAVFGAVYENRKAFSFGGGELFKPPIDGKSMTTVEYGLTAIGHTSKLFLETEKGMTHATPLTFSNSPMITSPADNGFQYPALIGELFENGSKKSIYLVNLDAKAYDLKIEASIIPFGYEVKSYSAPPTKYLLGEGLSELKIDSSMKTDKPIHIPPYSVTTIESPK